MTWKLEKTLDTTVIFLVFWEVGVWYLSTPEFFLEGFFVCRLFVS